MCAITIPIASICKKRTLKTSNCSQSSRYAPSKNTAILANLANRRVRARVLIATASVLLGNPPGGTAHGICPSKIPARNARG